MLLLSKENVCVIFLLVFNQCICEWLYSHIKVSKSVVKFICVVKFYSFHYEIDSVRFSNEGIVYSFCLFVFLEIVILCSWYNTTIILQFLYPFSFEAFCWSQIVIEFSHWTEIYLVVVVVVDRLIGFLY